MPSGLLANDDRVAEDGQAGLGLPQATSEMPFFMPTLDTMFERYGGLPFVTRFVLNLYDRVLASDRLAPYFAHADMQRLVEHQAKFVSSVMGGPPSYTPSMLRDAHAPFAIDDAAFDELLGLFRTTLQDAAIAGADLETMMASLNALRPHVVHAPKTM